MREQILTLIMAVGDAATELQERRRLQRESRPGRRLDRIDGAELAYVTGEVPKVRPAP
jgi:hypothetical protein